MQKLTGLLNFLGRAIVPGRAFTRRMYSKYKSMKQHHHIRVDNKLRLDCRMWEQFLCNPGNVSRPFCDFQQDRGAVTIRLETDASLNAKLGFGGLYCRSVIDNNEVGTHEKLSWFSQKWPHKFIEKSDCSIEVAELLGSCMAVTMWINELKGKRVVIWCDNQAVVHMINNSSSSCSKCMYLIRHLTLLCMTFSLRVFCKYISTEDNRWADQLSRMKIEQFLKEATRSQEFMVDKMATPLPSSLWPIPEPLWKPSAKK